MNCTCLCPLDSIFALPWSISFTIVTQSLCSVDVGKLDTHKTRRKSAVNLVLQTGELQRILWLPRYKSLLLLRRPGDRLLSPLMLPHFWRTKSPWWAMLADVRVLRKYEEYDPHKGYYGTAVCFRSETAQRSWHTVKRRHEWFHRWYTTVMDDNWSDQVCCSIWNGSSASG